MKNRNSIEVLAFELELHNKFHSFSALNFLKALDNGLLTNNDIERFFCMYKMSCEIVKEEQKEMQKMKNKK